MFFQTTGALLLSFTFAATIQAAPVLTPIENFQVLRSIDTICGDTWCEGESNWGFEKLSCDSVNGCVLNLTMKPYDYDEESRLDPRPFQCNLPAFTSKSMITEKTNRGLQYSVEFYEAISDCITDLNDSFGPMYVPSDLACPSLFRSEAPFSTFPLTLPITVGGTYGAVEAVNQLVRERSKFDKACRLEIKPYYRDYARCSINENADEVCFVPSVSGSYQVTLGAGETATVVHFSKPSRTGETLSN